MTDLVRFIWYAVTGVAALLVLGFSVRRAFNKRLENRARRGPLQGSTEDNPGIVPGK
jgi:bacteriorhodopsin